MKRDQSPAPFTFRDEVVQRCAFTGNVTEIVTKLTLIAKNAEQKQSLAELTKNEKFALCFEAGAPWETVGESIDGCSERLVMRLTVPCQIARVGNHWKVTGSTK